MASSTEKLEVEIELKCNAEEGWECLKNLLTLVQKTSSDKYVSVEVLEGDGMSVGSIFVVKYPPGHYISFSKKKIDLVDEENKTLIYSIIDWDLNEYYKNFKGYFVLIPKGEKTLLKWSCEFDKASEEALSIDGMSDVIAETARDMEAYFLKE